MKSSQSTVVIVGAGIVGLAHAWAAAERGFRVVVLERSPYACHASIRNFGMIWPIGQPPGFARDIALWSRARWLSFANSSGLWVNPCGSIHLAHHDDEFAVLHEFFELPSTSGLGCELLNAQQVLQRAPAANPLELRGGLYSPMELCINPRAALPQLAEYLTTHWGVTIHFATTAVAIEEHRVRVADGRDWCPDHVVVCGGADLTTLFPEVFALSGLKRCKLHMMKTMAYPPSWRLGPHLASGLTLRHYQNFADCQSLAAVKTRVAQESPELDQYGIHVMAAQHDTGEIILGDSHEYDDDITAFDKCRIDSLILEQMRKIVHLPDWSIAERWHGVYVKHPRGLFFTAEPSTGVHVFTGVGGAGMTLSFGLAHHAWSTWHPQLSEEITP